jgi:hypothetical protein
VCLIAGALAGHTGPCVTHTLITYAQASLTADAWLSLP